jgi:hypothetical protein
MPRPPILPLLDWRAIFASGQEYAAWIAAGEFPEKRRRMEEDLQTFVLEDAAAAALAALPRPVHVIAIAEDWCGDVVRHIPALQAMAHRQPSLRPRYIARAQHPEVFARFLTNGGEAIPKLVFLSADFVECGHWGPMPESCREWIARGKAAGDAAGARQRVAALYAQDPARAEVVRELLRHCDIASTMRL